MYFARFTPCSISSISTPLVPFSQRHDPLTPISAACGIINWAWSVYQGHTFKTITSTHRHTIGSHQLSWAHPLHLQSWVSVLITMHCTKTLLRRGPRSLLLIYEYKHRHLYGSFIQCAFSKTLIVDSPLRLVAPSSWIHGVIVPGACFFLWSRP